MKENILTRDPFRPSPLRAATNTWWDVTTQPQWGAHVGKSSGQFGNGIPLIYGKLTGATFRYARGLADQIDVALLIRPPQFRKVVNPRPCYGYFASPFVMTGQREHLLAITLRHDGVAREREHTSSRLSTSAEHLDHASS